MNNTKKLIGTLLAGAALTLAAPVFADSHGRGYDHNRHSEHFRGHDHRYVDRHHGYYNSHRPVYVERPYYARRPVIIEQPVYYSQPAPQMGIGALVGSVLGGIYDSNHQ